jgi:hypothetical protein
MEDLEKQIETLALRLSNLQTGFDRQEEEYYQSSKVKIYDLTKQVIKSPEAKEYWQQGMYTQEQMLLFAEFVYQNYDDNNMSLSFNELFIDCIEQTKKK